MSAKIYTGEPITQTPVVRYADKILIIGTDYTVAYKDNINAGTATVIVTGKGEYVGTKEETFEISKAEQPLQADDISVVLGGRKKISLTGARGTLTYTSDAPATASVDESGM